MVDLMTRVPRLPVPGETLAGRSFTIGYGGKGGNQAVTAARLGSRVSLVTRIGTDRFGDGAVANYAACGIGARYLLRDADRTTGIATILVDDAAQNCIAIVPGANAALTIADVRAARAAIAAADVVICQLEVPVACAIAAFEIARAAGVTTIFNPAPAADVPADIWRLTDIAVPNEIEAALVTGIAVESDVDAERAGHFLLARGARAAIVTRGSRGSLVVTADGSERIATVRVEPIDTTGAGDAFVGTLAVCLAAGVPLGDAARRAGIVAALSVTRPGTQTSFPSRAEAAAFLAEHGFSLPKGER
jgi:ribokinase